MYLHGSCIFIFFVVACEEGREQLGAHFTAVKIEVHYGAARTAKTAVHNRS